MNENRGQQGSRPVKVFPNPARNELKVECGNWQVEGITTADICGRNVLNRLIGESQESPVLFNVSPLSPGLYFIRMSGKNETVTKRIIKAKN